jgi:hypothetical protein
MTDFMAGRNDREFRSKKYRSSRSRNGARTVSDAKDRTEARPGKYRGKSLDKPSLPMTEKI